MSDLSELKDAAQKLINASWGYDETIRKLEVERDELQSDLLKTIPLLKWYAGECAEGWLELSTAEARSIADKHTNPQKED